MSTENFLLEFDQISPSLNRFAMKLTRNQDDAQDLYQETAYKAITNKEKFSPGTNLKAWLFTIMRNLFINQKRKLSNKMTFIDPTENLYYINTKKPVQNPGESNLMMEEMKEVMSKLSENVRKPFLMHFEGFKYHEIADALSLPLGTIKSRIYFARKTMMKLLVARYGDDFRKSTRRRTA